MPYNNSYNQEIAKQHMAQQYRAAENRNALNGGSLEAVGLDGSGLLGSAMSMKVAPIVSKIVNKLVASGYNGGNMAFVEKMLNEKFEKHGLPKSMIPTITKLINCFNTKGELNDIINALPIINAIVKPLIGGVSGLSGGVSTADYKMGEGRAMGCGRCGCDCCECSDCEMEGGGISSIAQVASAKNSYYDGQYRPLQLDDPVGPHGEYRSGAGHDNLIVQGGYRTKGAKDVRKRCPKGEHIARSTNVCKPHRGDAELKKAFNRGPGDNWIQAHPSYSKVMKVPKVPKAERPKRSNPGAQVRAAIVKQVMAEQGLSMIEASKFVKANNLYQPQARPQAPKAPRAKIDLGATHMNLPPSATKMRKPRGLTQLESNLSQIDPKEFKNQPPAIANPSSIFKAPKRAKKAKKYQGIPQKFQGEVSQIIKNAEDVFATDPRARELFKGIFELPPSRVKEQLPSGAREVFDAIGVKDLAGLREKRRQSAKSLPTKAKAPKKAKAKAKAVEEDVPARPDRDLSMLTAPEKRRYEIEMNQWAHSNYERHFDRFGNNIMPVREVQREEEAMEDKVIKKIIRERNKGSGVGAGMDQKEELMAERNGQYVGLAVGRPGVRPKKATGGRALVPIDQLPSTIGGSMNRQDYSMMI